MANFLPLIAKDGKSTPLPSGQKLRGVGNTSVIDNIVTADFASGVIAANFSVLNDTSVPTVKATNDRIDAKVLASEQGTIWKQNVRVCATSNGVLATAYANGQTVDGIVLATGDRIALAGQTNAAENGIYVVAASGAPARAGDADTWDKLVNAVYQVDVGTANADTTFRVTIDAGGTLDTTDVTTVNWQIITFTAGTEITITDGAIAVSDQVVTKTGTQTLTNKTLTSPTVTSPTINTGVSGTAIETLQISDTTTKLPSSAVVIDLVESKPRMAVLQGTLFTDSSNQLTGALAIDSVMTHAGYVVGIAVKSDTAFDASKTLALEPHKNGTGLTPADIDILLDDAPTTTDAKSVDYGTSGYDFAAGDSVGVLATTANVDDVRNIEVVITVQFTI